MSFKSLIIYKASAGSGKTFNLVIEYIALLLKNPLLYQHILAVTFTNKATAEMKHRIMSVLYDLKNGLETNYYQELLNRTNLSKATIVKNANIALTAILHDYSHFSIETIDSFFQRVLRNMTRELGIGSSYNLILDDEDIIDIAIERIIENMSEDTDLKNWYSITLQENIDNGKNWNIEKLLKDFAKNLNKEIFKTKADLLKNKLNRNILGEYKENLTAYQKATESAFNNYALTFIKLIKSKGLDFKDFSYGKNGAIGFFDKINTPENYDKILSSKRIKDAYEINNDELDNWINKTSKIDHTWIYQEIIPLFNEAYSYFNNHIRSYNTVKAVLKNIQLLGLLMDIDKYKRETLADKNAFLLSETANILAQIIQSEESMDISFVYEKMGCQYYYIMIDEFQDTSQLNWENFKILLSESLDNQNRSIIVGDIKQSIYRFNNGDWHIFKSLQDKGFQTKTKNYQTETDIKILNTNYRTAENIVNFNNSLFTDGLNFIYDGLEITALYKDVRQTAHKQGGNVFCSFYEKNKETDDFTIYSLLENEIKKIVQRGLSFKDITILCRNNQEITAIADYYSHELKFINGERIAIVSDEAFTYRTSNSIQLIINVLRYFENPKNTVALTYIQLYLSSDYNQFFTKFDYTNEISNHTIEWLNHREKLLQKPIFDLVLFLIRQLNLYENKEEYAFIFSFLDAIADFTKTHTSNLTTFLKFWEDELSSKTIPAYDQGNAIRILSIHKAKGLEFSAVIIPFCDWSLIFKNDSNYLWIDNQKSITDTLSLPEKFYELPVLPMTKNKMKNTVFTSIQDVENQQEIIDNINLLYVALTRAENSLSIFAKISSNNEINNVGDFIYAYLKRQNLLENNEYNIIENKIEENNLSNSKSQTNFDPEKETLLLDFSPESATIDYAQTKQAEDFIQALKEDNTLSDQATLSPKIRGIILHQLLSKIITFKDIDKSLISINYNGIISSNTLNIFKNGIQAMLSHPKVVSWFNNSYRVLNEAEMITGDDKHHEIISYRPDRIMINKNEVIIVDYKFTENKTQLNRYKKQILNYKNLVYDMGYKNIKTYLWFVNWNEDKIEQDIITINA